MKKLTLCLLGASLIFALSLTSCSSGSNTSSSSGSGSHLSVDQIATDAVEVYGSLGGDKAVKTIVDKSLNYAEKDNRVAKYVNSTTRPLVQTVLTSEICNAIGGPCDHSAISLAEALKGTGFNAAAGNAMMENIGKSFDDMKITGKAKSAVMNSLSSKLLKGL